MKQEKLRILAVEDNPADFRLLQEYLKEGLLANFELEQTKTIKPFLRMVPAETDLRGEIRFHWRQS